MEQDDFETARENFEIDLMRQLLMYQEQKEKLDRYLAVGVVLSLLMLGAVIFL